MTHTMRRDALSIELDPRCGKRELYRIATIIMSRSTGLAQSDSRVMSALRGIRTRDNKRYLGNSTIFESVREQALELLAQRETGQAWPTFKEVRLARAKQDLAEQVIPGEVQESTTTAPVTESILTDAQAVPNGSLELLDLHQTTALKLADDNSALDADVDVEERKVAELRKQLAEHEAARAQVDRDYDAWMRRAKNAEAEAAELREKNASLTAKSAMLTEDYNALARKMAVAHEDARTANEQVERLSQLLSIIHQTAKLGA